MAEENMGMEPASGNPPPGAARRILHLTLHRKWFDEIAAGRKKAEYRLLKPYWSKRLSGREYDEVHFRNGYAKDAPFMRVEWLGCDVGMGGETLPAPYRDAWLFVTHLGAILELRNYPPARSAPEASSPKGPTHVTPELPAPRAHGEKEGGQG